MPFMSVTEFEKRTSIPLTPRGDKLKAISEKLRAYNLAPTIDHLDDLRVVLNRWKQSHATTGSPNSWKQDRRNVIKGQNHPIEELDKAVNRQYREEARLALANAARALDFAYASDMKPEYRTGMLDTFHNTFASDPTPLQCYLWYRPSIAKGQQLWDTLLEKAGATEAQGKTDGLTLPMSASDVATANAWLDTNNNRASEFPVVGRYANAGNSFPRNRVIATSNLSCHTLVHEMLHWVTHEDFRDYTYTQIKDVQIGKFIREGLTEWLTRKGLNEWDKGGYSDLVALWQNIMGSGALSMADLKTAFFHGKDVKGVCDEVAKVALKNSAYKSWVDEAKKQNLLKWMS